MTFSDNREEEARLHSSAKFARNNPKLFFGDGGAIELALWFDKMESTFQDSSCTPDYKVGLAITTFRESAQSWWDKHTKAMDSVAANAIPWETLKMMMLEEFCPKSVRPMMEQELGNVVIESYEIEAYTTRFTELATMCPGMMTPAHKKTERYIWGLAPQIKEAVSAFKTTTFEDIRGIATILTNQSRRLEPQIQKGDSLKNKDNKRRFVHKKGNP